MRSSRLIRLRRRMHATSHDLKRETHLTEGHLVLPVLVAEGDHHLGGVSTSALSSTLLRSRLFTLSGSLSAVFKKSSPTVWFLHFALKFTHNRWMNLRMDFSQRGFVEVDLLPDHDLEVPPSCGIDQVECVESSQKQPNQ